MRFWLSSHPRQLSTAAQQMFRADVRRVINHITPRRRWAKKLSPLRKRVLIDLWRQWLRLTADLDRLGALAPLDGEDIEYRPQWFDGLFKAVLMRPAPSASHDQGQQQQQQRAGDAAVTGAADVTTKQAPARLATLDTSETSETLLGSASERPSSGGVTASDSWQTAMSANAKPTTPESAEIGPTSTPLSLLTSEAPDLGQQWARPSQGVLSQTDATSTWASEEDAKLASAEAATLESTGAAHDIELQSTSSPVSRKADRLVHGRHSHARQPALQQKLQRRLHSQHPLNAIPHTQALHEAVNLMTGLGIQPTRYQLQLLLQRTPSEVIFQKDQGATSIQSVARSLESLLSPTTDPISVQSLAQYNTAPPSPGPPKNIIRHSRFLALSAGDRCFDELEAGSRAPIWLRAREELRPRLISEIDKYFQRYNESNGRISPTKAQTHALWLLLRDTLLSPRQSQILHSRDISDPLELLRLMIGDSPHDMKRVHSSIIRIASAKRASFRTILHMVDIVEARNLPVPVGVATYLLGSVHGPDDMVALLPRLEKLQVTPAEDSRPRSATAAEYKERRRRRVVLRLSDIAREADRLGIGKDVGGAAKALDGLLARWRQSAHH